MKNLDCIAHIVDMYAFYRQKYSPSKEKIMSIAAAVVALAKSEEIFNEDEEE